MRTLHKAVLAISAFTATATPALAHPGHGSGLVAGLIHPLTGLDHLAAMVAVGLWAATRPARQAWAAPAAFMAALAAGAAAGVMLGAPPAIEPMLAASLLALGAVLVLATRLSAGIALTLITATGALHGLAHGAEASGSLAAYFAGFLASSALLHGAGWQLGRTFFSRAHGRVATGLVLGATGLALLAA